MISAIQVGNLRKICQLNEADRTLFIENYHQESKIRVKFTRIKEIFMISQILPIRFDNFKVPGKDMIHSPHWQKWYPSDHDHLSNWALRSILLVSDNRKVLVDTGFGNKQNKQFFDDFYLG